MAMADPADPDPFPELETPALLVERSVLDRNLSAMQRWAASCGVALRPHAKTHKCPTIGRRQVELGAAGLTVATLAEAESMVEAGVTDLFLAYPPVGRWRLERLEGLLGRATVVVGVGSVEHVEALARLGGELGHELPYRWEVDSGLGRLGTPPGAATVEAIAAALERPWTRFAGLFTHAGHAYRAASAEEIEEIGRWEGGSLVETAELLRARGVPVDTISVGSTPTARSAARVAGVTEIRPGTYVYYDATQVALGVAEPEDCAQTVLATVVGRPAPDRVVVDAGTKALPPENPSGRVSGFGRVVGHPDLVLERLFEEHGVLRASTGRNDLPVGHRVRLVPNHACTTTNLHARLYLVDGDEIERALSIEARDWRGRAGARVHG